MVAELVQLAQLAGQTVVTAASTDAWGKAKAGLARLLGRGDPGRTRAAEDRLEGMRGQLASAPAAELDRVREVEAVRWQARLEDLLEEYPGVAADLEALVSLIRAELPAGIVTASGHGVAAGGDISIRASGGGTAAGVIHGNVAPPDPTGPGPAG
jgi:hypothetical protein